MAQYNALKRSDEFRVLGILRTQKDRFSQMTLGQVAMAITGMIGMNVSVSNIRGIVKDSGLDLRFRGMPRRDHKTERTLFHWASSEYGHGIVPNAEVLRIHHKALLRLATDLGMNQVMIDLNRVSIPDNT